MDKITITLTEDEFTIAQECIEHISANERSYDKDWEDVLKSVAEKFNAEYIEDANLNYDSWHENEDINLKLKILENENDKELPYCKFNFRNIKNGIWVRKKCHYNCNCEFATFGICNDYVSDLKVE